MAQQLSMTNDARRTYRTVLGGQNVRVRVWWQPLDSNWYFSMSWVNRDPIVLGVRLTEGGRPLADTVTDFEGEIYVDGTGRPGRLAWTVSHRLLYLTPAEVAART